MKSIKDILCDNSDKNIAKITKAADKGNCSQFLNAFLPEVASETCQDFPNVKCLVTNNFFCCYQGLGTIVTGFLMIFPIDEIARVYRSNINEENKYDFDKFYLTVELKNGRSYPMALVNRNAKTFETVYTDVINCVRSRLTTGEV